MSRQLDGPIAHRAAGASVPDGRSRIRSAHGGSGLPASRILKLDVPVYYPLAALAPAVRARVAGLARRYLDSLQEIAVEQPAREVRLIGPRRDAATHRLAGFLARNRVGFGRVTLDDPE